MIVNKLLGIRGVGKQHITEAIAVDVDVAIEGVAGQGLLAWGTDCRLKIGNLHIKLIDNTSTSTAGPDHRKPAIDKERVEN